MCLIHRNVVCECRLSSINTVFVTYRRGQHYCFGREILLFERHPGFPLFSCFFCVFCIDDVEILMC